MDQAQEDTFRTRLHDLKQDLETLRDIGKSEAGTVMLDQQSVGRLSRMDALQRQAMGAEQLRRRDHALLRIDAALKRLADGEYGACTECGDDIQLGRLEADPATPHCISCASR